MNERADKEGIELAYASLAVFMDDGELDMAELDALLKLAMRDGEFSESEKAVLRNVFNRVLEEDVDGEVWERIQSIRRMHSI